MNDGDGGIALGIAGPRARSGWGACIAGIGALALAAAGCSGKSAPTNTHAQTGTGQRSTSTTAVVTHPTVRTFNAGVNPHDLVAVGRNVWVADFGGPLREYDAQGHRLKTIAVDVQSMAAARDSVWVGELSNSNTGPQGPLAEVDARNGRVVRRLKTRDPVDVLAVGDGGVWTASRFATRITRIPLNGGAQRTFKLPGAPTAIAIGSSGVWVAYGPNPGLAGAAGEPSNGSGGVVKLDPASGRELSSRFESVVPTALVVAHGSVWVALSNGVNGLDRLDEASDHSVADTPIPVGEQPTGLATGDGAVWVLNYSDGTITRVNPASGRVTGTIAFGPRTDPNRLAANSPIRLAVTPGTVWVSDAAANALHRLSAR